MERRIRQGESQTRTIDHDPDVCHVVLRDQQMIGYAFGVPIRALCGVVFVPSRDYESLPVCEPCVKERDQRLAGLWGLN